MRQTGSSNNYKKAKNASITKPMYGCKSYHSECIVPLVIIEVERNRNLSSTDDALCRMNKETNSSAIQNMSYLP